MAVGGAANDAIIKILNDFFALSPDSQARAAEVIAALALLEQSRPALEAPLGPPAATHQTPRYGTHPRVLQFPRHVPDTDQGPLTS